MAVALTSPPQIGQIVQVRGGIYLVTEVLPQSRMLETSGRIQRSTHLVHLTSLDERCPRRRTVSSLGTGAGCPGL